MPEDPALAAALEASVAAGLPGIEVAPLQARFLELLARLIQPRAILELGTLGGVSTISLARGLAPDGRLVSLELDPGRAEVARANLAAAGFADRTEVRVGAARDSLEQLAVEGAGPFELVFLDADKGSYPEYLEAVLPLTRSGSLIVADNVVRGGAVLDAASTNSSVQGSRSFLELVGADPRLTATALQTVGEKGYDGFALALVS